MEVETLKSNENNFKTSSFFGQMKINNISVENWTNELDNFVNIFQIILHEAEKKIVKSFLWLFEIFKGKLKG